ncbi:hypothetical protein OPU71_21180, partial [Niveibacterium sp. 24ML]|uniref:hypothetical protein n=1 Tax=Niveibacterium sp. 24ML TaxID=2985512 RepID=UPI002271F93F
DSARVTINHSPWGDSTNHATLSGAGLGLNWTGPQQLSGRLYWATHIGDKPELVSTVPSTRLWAELRWGF